MSGDLRTTNTGCNAELPYAPMMSHQTFRIGGLMARSKSLETTNLTRHESPVLQLLF